MGLARLAEDARRSEEAARARRLSRQMKRVSAASTTRQAAYRPPVQRRDVSSSRVGGARTHREPLFSYTPAHPTVRKLLEELRNARLSPLMRERAEQFLSADHPMGLLTECQRGHEFTLENTYFWLKDGVVNRQCRECRRQTHE
jgi:hypothetical protein